jgi:signal transduction histidine kinase
VRRGARLNEAQEMKTTAGATTIGEEHAIEQLAAFLCARHDAIILQWMAEVQQDRRITAADAITQEQLRDHLPQMLNDLTDTLLGRGDPDIGPVENAEKHGHHRWEQGYQLPELVREMARIRAVVVDHLLVFQEEHRHFSAGARRTALRRLHFFFDQVISHSTDQYVREQQAELRTLNEHLRAVDDARLRLIRMSTHDLRGAVNASHLATQVVAEGYDSKGRVETLAVLRRNLEHMAELVTNLLTFATLFDAASSPRLVPLRPCDLLHELRRHFRHSAELKGLRLEAECDPAVAVVTTDPTKLRQIGYNLISNALKYTDRGQVHVSIRAVDADRWSLVVQDSGRGISAEEREQLFTEYFRSPGVAHIEGTGLGLAIVQRLAELLEGEIHVESELGSGSRFEVILPGRAREDIEAC